MCRVRLRLRVASGTCCASSAAAAVGLTGTLATLEDGGWLRTGSYSYPAPEVRTVEWIGRRTAHELAHHLFDCRRLLAAEPG